MSDKTRATDPWGLVRIDDRLIHGQVLAVWCRTRPFKRIVLLDDDVAQDSFLQDVMRLAVPADVQVNFYCVEKGSAILSKGVSDRAATMLLLRSPQSARRLFDGGLRFTDLNIGGLSRGEGRKRVYRSLFLSSEDLVILEYLAAEGVTITFRTVPDDRGLSFSGIGRHCGPVI